MHLSDSDAKLFYKLFLGLICYVNEKYQIEPTLGQVDSPKGLAFKTLQPIKKKLWEESGVIDEYIGRTQDLTDDERDILSGWKNHRLAGDFVLMKHLKNYTVAMTYKDDDDARLYGVIGIYSGIDEMMPKSVLPKMVTMVLLPFKGQIIYDSFFETKNIRFGSGYRQSFTEVYNKIKGKYGIITQLDAPPEQIKLSGTVIDLSGAGKTVKSADTKQSAKKTPKKSETAERKRRIRDEILVDTYDEVEEFSAWHTYLTDSLSVPFEAVCIEKLTRTPLDLNEKVSVTGMADIDDCYGGMCVMIKWMGREFAIPLEQLDAIRADEETSQAIGDWKFWVKSGYSV